MPACCQAQVHPAGEVLTGRAGLVAPGEYPHNSIPVQPSEITRVRSERALPPPLAALTPTTGLPFAHRNYPCGLRDCSLSSQLPVCCGHVSLLFVLYIFLTVHYFSEREGRGTALSTTSPGCLSRGTLKSAETLPTVCLGSVTHKPSTEPSLSSEDCPVVVVSLWSLANGSGPQSLAVLQSGGQHASACTANSHADTLVKSLLSSSLGCEFLAPSELVFLWAASCECVSWLCVLGKGFPSPYAHVLSPGGVS